MHMDLFMHAQLLKLFLEGESRSHKRVVFPTDSVRILHQIKTKDECYFLGTAGISVETEMLV